LKLVVSSMSGRKRKTPRNKLRAGDGRRGRLALREFRALSASALCFRPNLIPATMLITSHNLHVSGNHLKT
jgi:hypothetical protein